METKSLQFNSGLVTYEINGVCKLSFNPTDAAFVERLYKAFDELDKKQEAYRTEISGVSKKEVFDIARQRDKEMRDMIDSIFESPVSDPIFGNMNVYAMADGLPVWANLILAIMEEIDTSLTAEQQKSNPRLEKYTSKYKKK